MYVSLALNTYALWASGL